VSADEIAHIIQSVLAPVVMVTACAITLGGLMTHYGAVNDRLRTLMHERLDLLRESNDDPIQRERLSEIDHQAPELVRRHRRVRDAILAIYGAMVALVACMFAIAWAAVSGSAVAAAAVLVLFLLGMLALLVGLFISALEIRISHRALDYEIQQVLNLQASPSRPPRGRRP
jgi:Protein of unknown function (DUF2721)